MASHVTIPTPSISSPTAVAQVNAESTHGKHKAVAVGIIKFLVHVRVYFSVIQWMILLVSLLLRRQPSSILFPMSITVVVCFYVFLLRAIIPRAILRNKFIKRQSLNLTAILTVVHLFIFTRDLTTLAINIYGMVNMVIWTMDDLFLSEEASGFCVCRREGGCGSSGVDVEGRSHDHFD
uniref:Transmembrane protein n=1 Tax=Nelumbo nucifera TaxID=4432 RepID=A0A822XDT1_NELNU|nr:TPA_asm: hypothetical protein HUJ06_019800 [Nelumbo nucifera]